MVDENDHRRVLRGIGRDLDRRFPPEHDMPPAMQRLMDALRRRDLEKHGIAS